MESDNSTGYSPKQQREKTPKKYDKSKQVGGPTTKFVPKEKNGLNDAPKSVEVPPTTENVVQQVANDDQSKAKSVPKGGKKETKPFYKPSLVPSHEGENGGEKGVHQPENGENRSDGFHDGRRREDQNERKFKGERSSSRDNFREKRKYDTEEPKAPKNIRPALAAQIAESKRLQELLPPSLPQEVVGYIKRVKEVISPYVEDHIISTHLEVNGFDVEKTINFFLENPPTPPQNGRRNDGKGKERVREDSRYERKERRDKRASLPEKFDDSSSTNTTSQGLWSTVAKKNTKHAQTFDPVIQRKPQPNPGHGQPTHSPVVHPPVQSQQGHSQLHVPQGHVQQGHVPQGIHPGFVKGFGIPEMGMQQGVNTNEMVELLAIAISRQLAEIQEKTRMLQEMQNELTTITTDNSTELNDLMHEKASLLDRESMLEIELRQVKDKLQHVEVALSKAEKEKALRVKELASKSQVVGIVRGLAPQKTEQQ